MGRLNHGRIKALDSPGLHGDGDTLYLRVAPGGSKSWIQRVAVNGWRRDIGLGGWPVVPLARARQRAFTNRVAISEGRDPLAEKRKASTPTFREAAIKTFEANRPRWRNVKTAKNWTQQLARHAFAIVGDTPVDRIGREEVGKALATVEASKASLCVKACLWFVALTVCRSGEARGAKWSEIDIEAREWRIPASRVKTNAEHRVPLSDAALAVLERFLPLRDSSDLVFPSVRGRELSNMTLKKCLRTAGHRRRTARFPHVIQDLDQRADQRASRRRRDGAGARGRICRRAELCPGRAVSIRERSGRSIGTFPTSCRSRLTASGRRLCSCRRRPAASTALVIVPRRGRSTSRQLG